MDDYNKKLDSLFLIPWDNFPSGSSNPKRQRPGFGNSCIRPVSEYIYQNLERHYPELKNIHGQYKLAITGCISLAIVDANLDFKTTPENPPRLSPNFGQFAIALQTNFFLGDYKLTPEDREFFFRVQREMEKHPYYIQFNEKTKERIKQKEGLKNAKPKKGTTFQ